MRSILSIIIVLILLISANIFPGGFQLNIRGAKAVAMGGAFTAVANDPSAVYWNASGLTQLKGTNIMFSTHLIAPQTSFRGVLPSIERHRAENRVFFPTHFFISHSFNEKLAAGFGFTQPFGLGTTWDEDWPGKYLAIETGLRIYLLTPVVSYKLFESLSLSAGLQYGIAEVTITRKSPISSLFATDAFVELEGNDNSSFGFNAGLMFKPTNYLTLGASYMSEMKYEFSGTATTTAPSQFASQLPSGNITAELTTPQNFAFGVAVDVSSRVKLSAEYQFVGWSSYDTLAVDFENPSFTDIASPRLYNDSFILRFGGAYVFNDQVTFMGGVYFDKIPVDPENLNPSLADSDRLGFSFGIDAHIFEKLNIVGSYLFIRAKELTITNSNQVYTTGRFKIQRNLQFYSQYFFTELYL